jgi:hypothetical protein
LQRQSAERNSNILLAKIWSKVADGDADGSVLLRSRTSCSRCCECLHPLSSSLLRLMNEEERATLADGHFKTVGGQVLSGY